MIPYTDITRLDLTDPANNPNGTIKDATSSTSNDGTLANKIYEADRYAFFQKCVRESGITPNSQFDNETNGYQLFEAIQKALLEDSGWVAVTDFGDNANGSDAIFGEMRVRKLNGFVEVSGSFVQSGTTNGFYLPVGYRPEGVNEQNIVGGAIANNPQVFAVDQTGNVYLPGGISPATYVFNSKFPLNPTI